MALVYLGLGSNIKPRRQYLRRARTELSRLGKIQKTSSIYETEPLGTSLHWYLNQVIVFKTDFQPQALLQQLKVIERQLGRKPGKRWSDREVDIDILLYNLAVIDTVSLHIPHLGLPQRKFVLVPLVEIAPDTIDPRTGLTIQELLNNCEPNQA